MVTEYRNLAGMGLAVAMQDDGGHSVQATLRSLISSSSIGMSFAT